VSHAVRFEAGDRLVAEEDVALARRKHPGDAVEEGCLARAVGTDEGEHLAPFDLEADVVDGHQAEEALGDALQLEDRLAGAFFGHVCPARWSKTVSS